MLMLMAAAAMAGPAESFVSELDGDPRVVAGCAQAQQLPGSVAAALQSLAGQASQNRSAPDGAAAVIDGMPGSMGIAMDQPVVVGLHARGGDARLAARFSVADPQRFSQAAAVLLPDASLEQSGQGWTLADGARASLRLDGDKGHLSFGSSGPQFSDFLQGARGVQTLLPRVPTEDPGCWVVADASGLPELGEVMGGLVLRSFAEQPDRLQLTAMELNSMQPILQVFEGERVRRAPAGTGSWPPMAVVRLNLDAIALLRVLASYPGSGEVNGREALLSTLEDLEGAGVRLRPGVELAVGKINGQGAYAAVVPLKRPWRARKLIRKLRESLEEQGRQPRWLDEAGGLLGVVIDGGEVVWLGADRGNLLVSNRPMAIHELAGGVGEPWTRTPMKSPGLHGALRLTPDAIPALSEPVAIDLNLVGDADGELVLDFEVDDLAGMVRQFASRADTAAAMAGPPRRGPAPDLDTALGSPPSTEAMSLLMLIATREQAVFEQSGAYVAYAGGPRDIDALDGNGVQWAGVPGLNMTPAQTACRYEVSLTQQSFTARAFCDADGDGKHAIYLVTPGGVPKRVTPPEVR